MLPQLPREGLFAVAIAADHQSRFDVRAQFHQADLADLQKRPRTTASRSAAEDGLGPAEGSERAQPVAGCHPAVGRIGADRGGGQLGGVGGGKRSGWRQGIVVSGGKTLGRCHAGPGRTSANRGFCLRRPFRIHGYLSVCLSRPFRIDGPLSVWLRGPSQTAANLGWQ